MSWLTYPYSSCGQQNYTILAGPPIQTAEKGVFAKIKSTLPSRPTPSISILPHTCLPLHVALYQPLSSIINDLTPVYLYKLVTPLQYDRVMRSSSQHLLNISSSRLTKYGDGSFSAWDTLPLDIELSPSVKSFKSNVKFHIFAD